MFAWRRVSNESALLEFKTVCSSHCLLNYTTPDTYFEAIYIHDIHCLQYMQTFICTQETFPMWFDGCY